MSRIDKGEYNYGYAQDVIEGCGFDFVDGLYIENMGSVAGDTFSDGTFSHNMEWVTYEAINFIKNDYTDDNSDDMVSKTLSLQQ